MLGGKGPEADEPSDAIEFFPGNQRAAAKIRVGRAERDQHRMREDVGHVGARDQVAPFRLDFSKPYPSCDLDKERRVSAAGRAMLNADVGRALPSAKVAVGGKVLVPGSWRLHLPGIVSQPVTAIPERRGTIHRRLG